MQIVIDIPEAEYNYILKSDDSVFADCASKECMMHAIKTGVLLPKGHGRLIDADELIEWLKLYDDRYNKRFAKTPIKDIPMYDLGHRNRNDAVILKIDIMPTVIEADKEVENEGNR